MPEIEAKIFIVDDDQAVRDSLQWLIEIRRRHTSELQSRRNLVCRLLLEKKKINKQNIF